MNFRCKICNRKIGANAMNFWAHLDKNGKVLEKQPNHYPEPIVYYESSKGEQGDGEKK